MISVIKVKKIERTSCVFLFAKESVCFHMQNNLPREIRNIVATNANFLFGILSSYLIPGAGNYTTLDTPTTSSIPLGKRKRLKFDRQIPCAHTRILSVYHCRIRNQLTRTLSKEDARMGGGTIWPEIAFPNDIKLYLGQQTESDVLPPHPVFSFTAIDDDAGTEPDELTVEHSTSIAEPGEGSYGAHGEGRTFGNDSGYFSAESEDAAFHPGLSDIDDDGKLSEIHSFAAENDDTSCPIGAVDAAYQKDTIDELADHWLFRPANKRLPVSDPDWWNVDSYPETCRSYAKAQPVGVTTRHDDELKIGLEAAVAEFKAAFSETEQAAKQLAETIKQMKRLIFESSEAAEARTHLARRLAQVAEENDEEVEAVLIEAALAKDVGRD
jgi:hypothetical protein